MKRSKDKQRLNLEKMKIARLDKQYHIVGGISPPVATKLSNIKTTNGTTFITTTATATTKTVPTDLDI